MKVSVFFATSGRPKMFRDALESLKNTTDFWELDVVAAIDADTEAWDVAREYGVRVWYKSERRGALRAWNDAFSMATGSIYVPAGDDQLFHEGWLEHALVAHRTHCKGFGVVGMNDCAYDGNTQVSTMFLMDRRWCKERMGGVFAPPCYRYYCIDSEINAKAKMLGEFYWESRSVVEHLHSSHGKRPIDATDKLKEEGWMEVDNKTFEDRKARGFPVEWESLI